MHRATATARTPALSSGRRACEEWTLETKPPLSPGRTGGCLGPTGNIGIRVQEWAASACVVETSETFESREGEYLHRAVQQPALAAAAPKILQHERNKHLRILQQPLASACHLHIWSEQLQGAGARTAEFQSEEYIWNCSALLLRLRDTSVVS